MNIKKFKNKLPKLGQHVYVDISAVVIGDVTLSDDVSVWPTSVIRGDVALIDVGIGTNIQDGSVLHVSHASKYSPKEQPLKIGNYVTIGHKAVIHGCTIGNYCLVGIGAIILDSAILEDYVMLGAGSLVPAGKVLEQGYLYLGAPAKKIRTLTASELEFLEYSAQHYIELKNEYCK